jgi:hypothetical protein
MIPRVSSILGFPDEKCTVSVEGPTEDDEGEEEEGMLVRSELATGSDREVEVEPADMAVAE